MVGCNDTGIAVVILGLTNGKIVEGDVTGRTGVEVGYMDGNVVGSSDTGFVGIDGDMEGCSDNGRDGAEIALSNSFVVGPNEAGSDGVKV